MSQTVENPVVEEKKGIPPIVQLILGVLLIGFLAYRFDGFARNAIAFVLTLGVLVFVHEWGHFQFARWAGMKVNRFALGFPPFVYTKRVDGIDYSIGALPIGGMVDIAGLGSEEEMVGTVKGQIAEPVRDTTKPFGQRNFQDTNLFWRFSVLFAGPLMNFLFAIVTFVGVYSIAGIPERVQPVKVQSLVPGQPAEKAGFKKGDEIVSIDNKPLKNTDDAVLSIRGGGLKPRTVQVKRGSETVDIKVTPVNRDLNKTGTANPSIGIAFENTAISRVTYRKVDTMTAVKEGFSQSMFVSVMILDTIKRAFTRDLSAEEVKGVGGPIKIAQAVGQASEYGWPIALQSAAMLSVNLGLLNLLPFPALDGGRIMFIAYEFITRRPFNPRWEGVVHAAGMVLLLAFMLFITLRDVASL